MAHVGHSDVLRLITSFCIYTLLIFGTTLAWQSNPITGLTDP